jgi:hypothetical protein
VSAKTYRFRSARTLGTALVVLLGLNALLSAVAVVLRLSELGLLQRLGRGELVSPEEGTRSDDRVAAIAIVGIVVLLITGIVWVVWQHRSQANLHAARLRELEYTPGWAVGWWLIPFANFVKPFQTVRELWKASGGEAHWRQVATWSLIGWWWAAWIVGLVLERVAVALVDDAATLDAFKTGSRLFLATEVVTIIAAILAISIVRAVTERQAVLEAIDAVGPQVPARPDRPDRPDNLSP